MNQETRCLNALVGDNADSSGVRICIVTPDLLGPVRNGGIGTSCTFLARELASVGHDVSILFTQYPFPDKTRDWMEEYSQRGIRVTLLASWLQRKGEQKHFPDHPPLVIAHAVHDWLVAQESLRPFDVVLFMEWQGHGFYSLHSKKNGFHFRNTALLVHIHSPSLWHSINNAELPSHPMQALTWFMERQSIALADAVITPSSHMLEWVRQHGYALPALTLVQPNLLEVESVTRQQQPERTPIRELVFFGRLEYRKGLIQFCDALDLLAKGDQLPVAVTFMGKCAWVGSDHAALYIAKRSRHWPMPVRILSTYDHQQALKYLSEPGRLAVMPSVADNSPYTVYECLMAQIPFVARDVGGVAELIAPEDRKFCLCDDNPRSLATLLRQALKDGVYCPALAFEPTENRQAWQERLVELVRIIGKQTSAFPGISSSKELPLVSVCLTHYNRPHFLRQAVDSLLKQDYPRFEVILADDGSPKKEARRCLQQLRPEFKKRGWKILLLPNGYPGKARNAAVRESRGEWLLFMDDDNVARPRMIRRFVEAALHSGAELLTSVFDVFTGTAKPTPTTPVQEQFLPVGGILSYSVITNVIGDTNALIKRSLFERLGGFTEDYGLGHEDFELYARAVLAKAVIGVIPESLFWYRRHPASVQTATNAAANRMRSLRPFVTALPADLAELAVLTHALALKDTALEERCRTAPQTLSQEEKRSFATRDPNAADSLLLAADELLRRGRTELASQLLQQIEKTDTLSASRREITILQAQACTAAAAGDFGRVSACATQVDASNCEDGLRASFYTGLLEALSHTPHKGNALAFLQGDCCRRLLKLPNLPLQGYLVLARYLFSTRHTEQALAVLERFLSWSETRYLSLRPDVAQAVKQGQFTCGLHHYALHGNADGTHWPGEEEIVPLLCQYKSLWEQRPFPFKARLMPYVKKAFF